MLDREIDFSPEIQALLTDLVPYVVVVGSVARGKPELTDLDLIYAGPEEAQDRVRAIIRQHGISYESCWPGNWCFRDHNHDYEVPVIQKIEILPFHRGESYTKCRRAGRKQQIRGL